MLLIRNNKLINVDVSEDPIQKNNFRAVKTLEMLKAEGNTYAIKDVEYGMCVDSSNNFNFMCIKSCYSDNSGLGSFITSQETKGELIQRTIQHGYKVYNGDVEISAFSYK